MYVCYLNDIFLDLWNSCWLCRSSILIGNRWVWTMNSCSLYHSAKSIPKLYTNVNMNNLFIFKSGEMKSNGFKIHLINHKEITIHSTLQIDYCYNIVTNLFAKYKANLRELMEYMTINNPPPLAWNAELTKKELLRTFSADTTSLIC